LENLSQNDCKRSLTTRVVVFQSSVEVRTAVINSIEHYSPALKVVADTGDISEAMNWLESGAFDLLILEPARDADGEAPVQGNSAVALARQAHEQFNAPTIFLAAKDDPVELIKIASELSSPLAFIRKLDDTFDAATEAIFHLALKNYQRIAIESGLSNTAEFVIDRQSERIVSCNTAAQNMFFLDKAQLQGQFWWQLLGNDKRQTHPLLYAWESGARTIVPPAVLYTSTGQERVMTGLFTPGFDSTADLSALRLRECRNQEISDIAEAASTNDTIACLGVDQISYGPDWSTSDDRYFLMDLRSSLLEIVRERDIVSLPQGRSIAILLRDIGLERADEVCAAFLSHLRSVPEHYGESAANVRMCIGLADYVKGQSSLQAMVMSNNALLCAQRDTTSKPIKMASGWDKHQLCGTMFVGGGVFSDPYSSNHYVTFRNELTKLVLVPDSPEDYLSRVLALLLRQSGVARIGIFRKRKDGRYRFLAGGQKIADSFTTYSETSAANVFSAAIKNPKGELLFEGSKIELAADELLQPLIYRKTLLGYVALVYEKNGEKTTNRRFTLDTGELFYLADQLPGLKKSTDAPDLQSIKGTRDATPLDTKIEGYVVDNMEGAVDQATFLAKLDVPVAIIGQRGTGKMYIGKIIHQESGGAEGMVVQIDCREFKSKDDAISRIGKLLERSEGKTLVFKSPHLMALDAQVKLARQISTRMLADAKPPRYLPSAKYVALFPETLEQLVQVSGLSERLASAFAGYPIQVPPVKDRKQAVLRWAYKILGQESAASERPVQGFTPDAEQAMLSHDWPGNISEMRQCIVGALERTDKEWITPVDLGLFKGISAQGTPKKSDPIPFLSIRALEPSEVEDYAATALEELDVALGVAVSHVAQGKNETPLGAWLEDELVLAVSDRYQGDLRLAADFLHTKPRNISRWMPKIADRQAARRADPIWRLPRRIVGEWVRETPHLSESPQLILENMLLSHVTTQCTNASVASRAKIMGVSVPTYQKKLQQISDR
jgi:DNA-binding NtrC family response regulator/PAS domain-containing protein